MSTIDDKLKYHNTTWTLPKLPFKESSCNKDNYPNDFSYRVASMEPGEQYKMCGVGSHFARRDVTDRENHFLHLLGRICDSFSRNSNVITVDDVNKNYSVWLKNFEGELGYQVMVYVTMVLEKVNEGDNDEQ